MAVKHEGHSSWNLIGYQRKGQEVKRKTLSRWRHARYSRFFDKNLNEESINLGRKQVFHQEIQLMEFMRGRSDDMRNESYQGIEDIFNQGSCWKEPR